MDHSVFAGPSASGYDALGTEDTEQSATRRLPTPGRRPGGPRQASRIPNAQDVRNESTTLDVAHSTDMGVIPSNPNATAMDIDLSCLDALDDQLLASPIDSFMDVCWAEAVGECDLDLSGDSPTLYNAPISNPQNEHDDKGHDDYYDLHPLDSDNEPWDKKEDVSVKTYVKYDHEAQKHIDESTLPQTSQSQPSLAFWEPHFRIPDPNDTVHGFPSRPEKSRRTKLSILAGACSRFPGRLKSAI